NPQSQYAHWMMKAHPDWTVLNRGIDGETATEIRGRFARDVLSAKPAYVIILAGVNDIFGGSEAELVERELARMYADALDSGIVPVAATVQSRNRRSEEHTSELQSPCNLVCRLLLEKKNKNTQNCSTSTPK